MIEQKIVHTCDAPGCDVVHNESVDLHPSDLYGVHIMTPGPWVDGWVYADGKHYCRKHDVTVSVEITDRAEPRPEPV